MTRVLLIGIKPEAVDVSDPDLPPGTTSEKIAAGITTPTLSDMKARGWEGAFCSILPDESAEATIAASLAEALGLHRHRRWHPHPVTEPAVIRAGHQRRPSRRCWDANRVQHLPKRHSRCGGEVAGRGVVGIRSRP